MLLNCTRMRTEVLVCTHAAAGYVAQTRAHSGPVQDIASGAEVPVDRQAAARAVVLSNGQTFGNLGSAPGAILSGVSTIHLDQAHTSLFSFVAQQRDELPPRGVVDVLGQGASRQTLYVELLHRDCVIVTDQPGARLMEVLSAPARRLGMTARRACAGPAPSPGAALLARERPLRDPNSPLSFSSRSEARNEASIRQSCEGRDTQVHTDRCFNSSRIRVGNLDHEAHKPALAITLECAALDEVPASSRCQ
jgi:hypothetical protein